MGIYWLTCMVMKIKFAVVAPLGYQLENILMIFFINILSTRFHNVKRQIRMTVVDFKARYIAHDFILTKQGQSYACFTW